MMKPIARMKAVMIKEIRQLSRDRITFGMVVMIPLIQLLLFGFAINTDIRNIPVGVVDQSGNKNSLDNEAIFVWKFECLTDNAQWHDSV